MLIPGYETTFITKSELSDETLSQLCDRLTAVVGEFKGELVLKEDWGKRKLAYSIRKESRAQYTYLVYTGTGDVVHEIERNLRLNEHVIRFLTVNLEKEFDPEVFKKSRSDNRASIKRREEEREARREERMAERKGSDHYYEDRSGPSSHAEVEEVETSEE